MNPKLEAQAKRQIIKYFHLSVFYFIAMLLLVGVVTPMFTQKVYAETGITKKAQIGSNTVTVQYPASTAVDSNGNVFIFSYTTNSINKLSSTGAFITQWGGLGGDNGQFREAYRLAIDSSNNVYVADRGNNRIQKFSNDGTFITKWGSTNTDSYGASQAGSGDGDFSNPTEIAVDSSDNIYVFDSGNYRIKKIDNSGSTISIWGWGVQDGSDQYQICTSSCQAGLNVGNNTEIGKFNNLAAISTDNAGNVYIADSDKNRIQKYDSSGNFVNTFGWGVQDGSNQLQVCSSGCQDGTSGSGQGQFSSLAGLAVDTNGNIFVTDTEDNSNRIQKFSSNAAYVTQWGGDKKCASRGDVIESGKFCYPQGLSIDNENNVLVADPENNNVQKFDGSGTYLDTYGNAGLGNGAFAQPYGNAVDKDGNIYVTDAFNNRVQKFDSSGNFITKWGTRGYDSGQFSAPIGIAVDSSNNVYVTDAFNNRVQKFSSSGTFITKWGSTNTDSYGASQAGSGDGEFSYPGGIAIDSSNNVYVADNQNDRIQKFSSSGTFVQNIGTSGTSNGQLNKPTGLAVDQSGNIYVADTDNLRVQKFTSSGSYESQYALSSFSSFLPYSITGISTGTNGKLYIGEGIQGRGSVRCDNDESSNGCDLGSTDLSVTVPNAVNAKPISLSQTGCANITNAASSTMSSQSVKDPVNTYPVGLVSFTLTGCSSGGSSTVKVSFAGVSDPKSVKLRKYNATTKKYSDVTGVKLRATSISGQQAVEAEYTIVDGGPLDGDSLANGTIEDPVGLVTASGGLLANTGAVAISLYILLSVFIASFAYVYIDYRKHKKPLLLADPKVHYGFGHHVSVVTIPLLRYRIRLNILKMPYGGGELRRF